MNLEIRSSRHLVMPREILLVLQLVQLGTLSITNPGIGYTPGDGSFTFSNVNLITITGNGSGASAEISIADGVAVAATITGNGGNGYQVGDVVSINAIGEASIGRNARFTLTSIGHTSQLLLIMFRENLSLVQQELLVSLMLME